jgi:hypothetical protein
MSEAAGIIIQVLALLLFALGVLSFVALVKGCFALRRMWRSMRTWDPLPLLRSPLVPGVSVIAVPPDVSPESREFIRRLLDLHFGNFELVVVLDGPSGTELDTWRREFRLALLARDAVQDLPTKGIRGVYQSRDPYRMVVVDKERGGRADALNAGVNLAALPTIALIDPESSFDPTILLRLAIPMLEDPELAVVCGAIPDPATGGFAANVAALESLRAWMVRCAAFSGWRSVVPVPGSALLIRREEILKAGGFHSGPLEMVLHLERRKRLLYLPEDVRHASAPDSIRELKRRTQREQVELGIVWRRRKAIGGGIAPAALFGFRLVRPLLETVTWIVAGAAWFAGWIDSTLAGLVVAATAGMGVVVSMAAVALRELGQFEGSDPGVLLRLFFTAIPENLGYRQIRNLWLIGAFWKKAERMRAA